MIYCIVGICKCGVEFRITKKGYYVYPENQHCEICKPVNADPKKK